MTARIQSGPGRAHPDPRRASARLVNCNRARCILSAAPDAGTPALAAPKELRRTVGRSLIVDSPAPVRCRTDGISGPGEQACSR
jgi:hypothetical protein